MKTPKTNFGLICLFAALHFWLKIEGIVSSKIPLWINCIAWGVSVSLAAMAFEWDKKS
jgi:hypothetical protein